MDHACDLDYLTNHRYLSPCQRWREPGTNPNGFRRNRVSGDRRSKPGTGPISGFPCDRQCDRGTVRGPKINGTIVAPSGDWLIVMADGSLRLDVRATIKTDDGEIILVTYSGAIARSKEVADRFNNGEVITSKDIYFITAPQFTTGSKKYDWINHIQAVGKMVSTQRGVNIKYDLFIVR